MQYEVPSVSRVGQAINLIHFSGGMKDNHPADGQIDNVYCSLEETDD